MSESERIEVLSVECGQSSFVEEESDVPRVLSTNPKDVARAAQDASKLLTLCLKSAKPNNFGRQVTYETPVILDGGQRPVRRGALDISLADDDLISQEGGREVALQLAVDNIRSGIGKSLDLLIEVSKLLQGEELVYEDNEHECRVRILKEQIIKELSGAKARDILMYLDDKDLSILLKVPQKPQPELGKEELSAPLVGKVVSPIVGNRREFVLETGSGDRVQVKGCIDERDILISFAAGLDLKVWGTPYYLESGDFKSLKPSRIQAAEWHADEFTNLRATLEVIEERAFIAKMGSDGQ